MCIRDSYYKKGTKENSETKETNFSWHCLMVSFLQINTEKFAKKPFEVTKYNKYENEIKK
ncbi:MAG: hypothetical protein KIH80_005450, partial [Flavobacteriia bacterium]|nr:hypothetical protein [Flavobacteriia bacterium]